MNTIFKIFGKTLAKGGSVKVTKKKKGKKKAKKRG